MIFEYILLIIPVALIIVGLFFLYSYMVTKKKLHHFDAKDVVISGTSMYYLGDSRHHETYVDYTYNNVEYKDVKLNYHTSSFRKGKTITVFINPDNPTELIYQDSSKLLGVSGVCFLCIGAIALISML